MDSYAHRIPSSLPLDELVAHALSELGKINYSRRSVRRYRTVWGHLVTFSRERSLGDRYSEQLRVPRDATIPSVWEPELVVRLLKVVDRSSPRGKRDYAILLLACRLGLRLGDNRPSARL